MNEWTNEWVSKWVSEWVNEWMNERMNEWMNERTNEFHIKSMSYFNAAFNSDFSDVLLYDKCKYKMNW